MVCDFEKKILHNLFRSTMIEKTFFSYAFFL